MKAHDLVGTAYELLVDEDCREGGPPPGWGCECALQLMSIGQLIKLVNCGVCSEATDECLDGVGYATSALAEYHHRFVGR